MLERGDVVAFVKVETLSGGAQLHYLPYVIQVFWNRTGEFFCVFTWHDNVCSFSAYFTLFS